MQLEEIIEEVKAQTGKRKLVVITGGEPMRQPLSKLCQQLVDLGLVVQIETNGTFYRELPQEVEIVCSPKNMGNGYAQIREDLLERINALKFVVSVSDELYSGVADVGQDKFGIPIYVQPMDEKDEAKNKKNFEYAIKLVEEGGYRLSVQQHKFLGLQ
jgi:organic radical activating enzyme